MNSARKILLSLYVLVISILGIFFIPTYLIWTEGDLGRKIISFEYLPIWKMMDKNINLYSSIATYEISIPRVLYMLALVTLVTLVLYIILGKNKSDNKSISENI